MAEKDDGPRLMDVTMHEVLKEPFEAWLRSRGLVLQRTPFLDENPNMPTYNVGPSEELINKWMKK